MNERLDAYLSHRGYGTRSETRTIIRRGRVAIAGRVQRDPALKVEGKVTVDREPVPDGPFDATLILHKPLGVACSHDPGESPLIYESIPEPWVNLPLESAGRLDRETSVLLILTTDGPLIHRLTNPRRHLRKRYRIHYAGELCAHAVERCAKGLELEDDPRPTLPAELELHAPGTATLWLSEGRYHQVRRMIAALGAEVTALHRDRIGGLDLPQDLSPGMLREISTEELARLGQE